MAYIETEQDVDDQEEAVQPIIAVLAASLVPIFNSIGADFESNYIANGTAMDAVGYESSIRTELRAAYNATNLAIGGDVTDFILRNPDDSLSQGVNLLAEQNGRTLAQQVDDIVEDTIQALDDAFEARLADSLPKITDTTNNQIERYISNAEDVAEGAPRTVRGALARQEFEDNISWRTNTIAEQEVGASARNIKQVEVDTLGGSIAPLEAQGLVVKIFIKEWLTRGDDLVRPAHVEADGQTRDSDVAYDVMGEKLNYPRDTSLGATAANVMHCRCESLRRLDLEIEEI